MKNTITVVKTNRIIQKINYHISMVDSKDIKLNFGKVVKELRLKKDITQEQLAEYLELQPYTITSIETGRSFISSDVLAKLCNFFEVDAKIFFTKKAYMTTPKGYDFIKEIKYLLPNISEEKLEEINKNLLVMQK